MSTSTLTEYFEETCGPVSIIKFRTDSNQTYKYALVQFEHNDSADKAIIKNKHAIDGPRSKLYKAEKYFKEDDISRSSNNQTESLSESTSLADIRLKRALEVNPIPTDHNQNSLAQSFNKRQKTDTEIRNKTSNEILTIKEEIERTFSRDPHSQDQGFLVI